MQHQRSRTATAIAEADANAEGSGVDSDGAGVEIVEEPDAPPASADRKGHVGRCGSLSAASAAKSRLNRRGPGANTWVPCVKGFNCCHEGGPAQVCRQCAAKMSLDNEILAGKIESETASHCNDCWEEYKAEVYHELTA
eukprot:jgi/Astpho2/9529/Aster-03818